MSKTPQRILQPGERIRVLVVDDSVVIRRLLTHALEEEPSIEVVGSAANGAIALQRIPQFNPDVVTLDIEMPEMNGLDLLRRMRVEYPGIRVIMFSTLTERGATETIEALSLGADDYVTKPSNEGSLDRSLSRLRDQLVPRVRQFFRFSEPRPKPRQEPATNSGRLRSSLQPKLVAIGVSTGGPAALGRILPEIPSDFPLPVLIVQHMPAMFTRLLADRLHAASHLAVAEAGDGDRICTGKILIAPGDYHMRVLATASGAQIRLDQSPPLNSCRPSVDALFASVGEAYGGAALGVVLTGMGRDGLRGAQILKAQGAGVLAQDEASSVIWGMPGTIVAGGLADRVLPLEGIVPEILRLVRN